jgi:ceramide glucosyltransferase
LSLGFVLECIGAGLLILAVCGAGYGCAATWAIWRFSRRPQPAPAAHPAVTVLKPMRGDEPGLYENLESFCRQDYAGPVQLILGAQDPDDPALAAARQLKAAFPDRDITVLADPTLHGTNRKIGNVINMAAHARGEVIAISDSDVRLPPDGLSRIVATLQRPGVGLVHCLYRGRPTASAWSRLAALDVNARFAASVMVGEALGAHPVLGPTMALPAKVLDRIGGVRVLADVLADDFELGRAVRGAGYAIACPPMVIDHVFPETSLRDLLDHELRWARTIRLVNPFGYLGSGIMHVTPLALFGAALTGFTPWSFALALGLTAFRYAQAALLVRIMRADGGLLWLLPVRDLLSLWVFLVALVGRGVVWRGARLKVARDGAIAAT